MEDYELLGAVKLGLGIATDYNDNNLQYKVLAIKHYMLNAGITIEQIESDLGIAALTIGVNDLWNTIAGDVKFSTAFNILMAQLMVVSLPDV